eukprot:Pompholyxophrys_punicea_v1_NODE_257_length_2508_cov_3.165919.p5 type:complete len:107 gc:universal NODE_257_length_2508_cov_3.165919:907-1227(+)
MTAVTITDHYSWLIRRNIRKTRNNHIFNICDSKIIRHATIGICIKRCSSVFDRTSIGFFRKYVRFWWIFCVVNIKTLALQNIQCWERAGVNETSPNNGAIISAFIG